ncbi:MAG: hypothetical protein U0800_18890 [Isosphaeraceae bacterium]
MDSSSITLSARNPGRTAKAFTSADYLSTRLGRPSHESDHFKLTASGMVDAGLTAAAELTARFTLGVPPLDPEIEGMTGEFSLKIAIRRANGVISLTAGGKDLTAGLTYSEVDHADEGILRVPATIGHDLTVAADLRTVDPTQNSYIQVDVTAMHFARDFRTPVILLPGIFGSFVPNGTGNNSSYQHFLTQPGLSPQLLALDPLLHTYDGMVNALVTSGYVLNEDLFLAPYDWRLPVAPESADPSSYDGVIPRSAAELAAPRPYGDYLYGIDYLGYALRRASEAWFNNDFFIGGSDAYPNTAAWNEAITLQKVDIIAHSMGGLVAQSYIQSTAYGQSYPTGIGVNGDAGFSLKMPTVDHLITIGTPYLGAAKAWNPWHDNWTDDFAYKTVLAMVLDQAWETLRKGTPIVGGGEDLEPSAYSNDEAGRLRFIHDYARGIRDLLPAYDGFAANFDPARADPDAVNYLARDLQAGKFVNKVGHALFVVGWEYSTIQTVVRHVGTGYDGGVVPFGSFRGRTPAAGEVWYESQAGTQNGDGTVPLASALAPHLAGQGGTLFQEDQGDAEHSPLMGNADVLRVVLAQLGRDTPCRSTSTRWA